MYLRALYPLLHGVGALVAALVVLTFVGIVLLARWPGRRWPLRRRASLLTDPERRFFRLLGRAAPGLTVFCQVSVLQLLEFEERNTQRFWSLFRRLGPMSVDFVLCRPDGAIVACIELDDSSHSLPRRIAADQVKDRAFRDAGMVLLRVPLSRVPSVAELSDALALLVKEDRGFVAQR